MSVAGNLIWEGRCVSPNGAGVYCPVHVYDRGPVWGGERYGVYVGGWRVALLKTERGAVRRAEREVVR